MKFSQRNLASNGKIQKTSQALNDLKGIYTYIYYNLSSPVNAKNQIRKIKDAIKRLDTFPNGYPIVDFDPWQKINMHKLVVNNYIVFYMIEDETSMVYIARFAYSGRDIKHITNEV